MSIVNGVCVLCGRETAVNAGICGAHSDETAQAYFMGLEDGRKEATPTPAGMLEQMADLQAELTLWRIAFLGERYYELLYNKNRYKFDPPWREAGFQAVSALRDIHGWEALEPNEDSDPLATAEAWEQAIKDAVDRLRAQQEASRQQGEGEAKPTPASGDEGPWANRPTAETMHNKMQEVVDTPSTDSEGGRHE